MRRILPFLVILIFLGQGHLLAQTGVSINDDGTAADPQSILDLNVNSPSATNRLKGALLPRMSTADRDNATYGVNPGAGDFGLMIFNTTTGTYQYWNGSAWVDVATGLSTSVTLDAAYDGGGSGAGRTIVADAGNVEIQGAGFLTVGSNLGIGTTTPAEKLAIQFSGRGGILLAGDNTQDVFIQLTNDAFGSNYIYSDQSDNNNLKLESAAGKEIKLLSNGPNERMVVQSDGRVRINNLADPNSAVVISNPAGVLGKTPLTGSATDVLLGTGSFGPASNFADDDWYQTLSTNQPTAITDWIYTNGRVGIGVGASSNPSAPLQVAASGAGNPDANSILSYNPNNSAGNDAIITTRVAGAAAGDPFISMDISGEAGWSMGVDNSHDNRFKIAPNWNNLSSSTAVSILTNGNVGIGTDDPGQKLEANGIMRSRGAYMIDVDGANGSGPRIAWGTTSDVYAMMNLGAYGGINNLETKNRDFRIGSNSVTNALYLENGSGNIGIGTNAPNNTLTIEGSNSDTQPILGLRSGNDNNGVNNGAQIAFGYNGTNSYQHFIQTRHNSSNSQNAIDFYVSDGTQFNTVTSGSIQNMSLVSGNVGIGTTAPAQKLHVVGTGRFSALGGLGNRVVYTNNSGDLITSSSTVDPNSLIDGSGTLNYLARWTPDGNTLGIGATYDNGTNVGIGTTSPGQKLHVNGSVRGNQSGALRINTGYGYVDVGPKNTSWSHFYTDRPRFWFNTGITVDSGNMGSYNENLSLQTSGTTRVTVLNANGNVGIATTAPSQKLHIAGNELVTGDIYVNNASYSSLHYGNTGRLGAATGFNPDGTNNGLYVEGNNNGSEGGGIFMNGNTFAIWSPGDNDILKVYDEDNFAGGPKFRVDENFTDVNGYLTVGDPNTGSTVKKGKKTFVDGSTINIYNGTGNYNFTWNMGQLDLPPGASSITVKSITYNMTGYRRDTDESISIRAKIGGNVAGWTLTSGYTFGGGGDQYYDWNYAEENLNWSYSSNQTVQFQLVEENETCFFCNNDYFTLYNIEVTVYYEYTTAPQAGTILAEGRIYANSTVEVGDMAEYFEVVDPDVEVGHLVSLIPGSDNQYKLTETGYDPYLMGVISENPSVVLNSPDIGPPVALAGRVKVKLVSGMPLIKSGDFITSSPQRGLGMKARKPGTVIGYAVENQMAGQDEVEVLLQPGRFYYPVFDNDSDELPRQKFSSGK